LIPTLAYPQAVFFLLSQENFVNAFERWLGYALEHKGYDVSGTELGKIKNIYRETLNQMGTDVKNAKKMEQTYADAKLRTIVARSVAYRELRQKTAAEAREHQQNWNCQKCQGLDTPRRCTTIIPVIKMPWPKEDLGCGITNAEGEARLKPKSVSNTVASDLNKTPGLYSPAKFKLTEYGPNEAILKHCGRHLYIMEDEKGVAVSTLDFWLYKAFSDDALEKLISHHEQLLCKPQVKRGKIFTAFGNGKMVARGTRAPMGGRPGDGYAMYHGMDADSEDGMNALFNDAEDTLLLDEVARSVHPGISRRLRKHNDVVELLGTTGTTLYSCSNYTAPIHHDRDEEGLHGLCAQFYLQADERLQEYSFIYGEYRIFFVARGNSLWSFAGEEAHGTMLPSKYPLHLLGSELDTEDTDVARISRGVHLTKTKSNLAAANKYDRARRTREGRNAYWSK
ncbi:hypothetical protein FPV67DRAFT_1408693, partial [Lyophyllum atratum]